MQQLREDYLTVEEAAKLLGISKITLHRWLKRGLLPAYSFGPRRLLIKRADIHEVLKPINKGELAHAGARLGHSLEPLSDDEVREGLAAMEAGRALSARLSERLGNAVWKPWSELINESQDERAKQIE